MRWTWNRIPQLSPADEGGAGGGEGEDGGEAEAAGEGGGTAPTSRGERRFGLAAHLPGGNGSSSAGEAAGDRSGEGQGEEDSDDEPLSSPPTRGMPKGLPEKYWDAKKGEVKVADLLEGYNYFRGKVASGLDKVPKRPEDYKLEVPDVIKEQFKDTPGLWDPESENVDPLLGWFLETAREEGLNHHQVNRIFGGFMEKFREYQDEFVPRVDPAEEIKKLGHGGDKLIEHSNKVVDRMIAQGVIKEHSDEAIELQLLLDTAAGVRAMAHLVEYLGGPSMPVQVHQLITEAPSKKEVDRELSELMARGNVTDDEFEKVQKKYESLYTGRA